MLLGCLSDRNSPGHSGRSVHHGTDGNHCSSHIYSLSQGSGNEGAQAAHVRSHGPPRRSPAAASSAGKHLAQGSHGVQATPPPSSSFPDPQRAGSARLGGARGSRKRCHRASRCSAANNSASFLPRLGECCPSRSGHRGVGALYSKPLELPPPWSRVSGASEWGTGRGLTEPRAD